TPWSLHSWKRPQHLTISMPLSRCPEWTLLGWDITILRFLWVFPLSLSTLGFLRPWMRWSIHAYGTELFRVFLWQIRLTLYCGFERAFVWSPWAVMSACS